MATDNPAVAVGANTSQTIEVLWREALKKLHSMKNELLLPVDIQDVIGINGIEILAERLNMLLNTTTVAFVDNQLGCLRIMTTPTFLPLNRSQAVTTSEWPVVVDKGKATVKDDNPKIPKKVSRPPNGFILYRTHQQQMLKAGNPNLLNKEVSVICGKQWKNESEDVKAQFIGMAEVLKKKHAKDNPGYVYNQRKSSENKKMTARKAAAIAKSISSAAGPSTHASITVPNTSTDEISDFPHTDLGEVMEFESDTQHPMADEVLGVWLEQQNDLTTASNTNLEFDGGFPQGYEDEWLFLESL